MHDLATLPVLTPADVEGKVVALARRHQSANGAGMRMVQALGGSAETLFDRLPDGIRGGLTAATAAALQTAFDLASASRSVVGDKSDWLNGAISAALGAAGGAGGLPTALAELPVTTTVLLRAIQGIAREHGFDPAEAEVRADCLRVFASAGPLARDDAGELGFYTARVTITGQSVQSLIAAIAPRLSAAFGQKLAAQAAPVIGAATGAALNWVFTGYYQEMARVHFGIAALSRDTGISRAQLYGRLKDLIEAPPPA
jgi:hypothetical protein